MQLVNALHIGQECGMRTVKEAILNIDHSATSLFTYAKIQDELDELYVEWGDVMVAGGFDKDSPIEEVLKWLKEGHTDEYNFK